MRATRRRNRWRVVLSIGITLIASLCVESPTMGQASNEPIVFGQRQKRDPITLYNSHAYLEATYLYTRDRISPDNQPTQSFTEHRFEEALTLESQGAIIHPNLVELNLSGTFGLTQSWLDNDGQHEQNNGTILEYDLNATFLRKEEAPVTIYARRTQNTVDREFGPTLENTLQTEGFFVDWHHKRVPTRIEAFHSDQKQTGLDDTGTEFELAQNSVIWHSEYRPTSRQLWTWDYTINQIEERTTGQPSNDFITHNANLSHSADFGYKDRSNLSSSLTFFDQGGDFPFTQLAVNERLRLVHSDTFETDYRYAFQFQEFLDVEQYTNTGQVGLTHRLYKSLTTNAYVGIEDSSRSDGSGSLTTFGHIDFDYHKNVPYGFFSAFLAGNVNLSESEAQSSPTQIINEAHTFADPAPLVLGRQNIDVDSIRVTDSRDIVQFTLGADYTITTIGELVQINRVIGGRISNGQTVLVDYTVAAQGASTTNTYSYSVGGRYDIARGPFKGLSLYSRFTDQRQDVDSDDFVANEFTDTVIGAEYRIWRLLFGAEQEWYDSTLYPFDATRFFARYIDRFTPDTSGVLNLSYTILKYPEEDNTLNLFLASAQVSHRFTRTLSGFATVVFRDENDDLQGQTVGFEEQVELNWTRRQTTVYVLFRNSDLNTDNQDSHFQIVRVGLRREF